MVVAAMTQCTYLVGAARACRRGVRKPRAWITGLAIGVSAPSVAHADAETERARALFDEAGALERQGQWGAAQDRLRAALRLKETPQLYYALGWALENDDKLLEAKTEYEMAVRLGNGRANAEEAVRLATARLVDLERKTPLIRVRIAGRARVFIDGKELPSSTGATAREENAPVNPGSHVLRVQSFDSARSRGVTEQMVYVSRSTVRTIDVDAPESVAGRTSPHARHDVTLREGTAGSDRVLPWVLLGGGALFLGGGTALLVSSADDGDRRDAYQARWCTATSCVDGVASRPETADAAMYRREAADATSAGNTKQAVAFALGGVGLVSAAIGAVLLLRQPASKERAMSFVAGPQGAGAAVRF
jgi:hypothetical protein